MDIAMKNEKYRRFHCFDGVSSTKQFIYINHTMHMKTFVFLFSICDIIDVGLCVVAVLEIVLQKHLKSMLTLSPGNLNRWHLSKPHLYLFPQDFYFHTLFSFIISSNECVWIHGDREHGVRKFARGRINKLFVRYTAFH